MVTKGLDPTDKSDVKIGHTNTADSASSSSHKRQLWLCRGNSFCSCKSWEPQHQFNWPLQPRHPARQKAKSVAEAWCNSHCMAENHSRATSSQAIKTLLHERRIGLSSKTCIMVALVSSTKTSLFHPKMRYPPLFP